MKRFRSSFRRSGFRRLRYLPRLSTAVVILLGITVLLGRLEMREVRGAARVVDGDSLTVAGQRLRLGGIDAPEIGQICRREGGAYACGDDARRHLAGLIGGREILCSGTEHDRYDRLIATCRSGDLNLNRQMVRDGWAVAYGDYRAEERAARAASHGLWRGAFERPREWREIHRDATAGR